MTDMWTQASRDTQAERSNTERAKALVALADLRGFLCQASSEAEYEDRLALVRSDVDQIVTATVLLPADRKAVYDTLRSDALKVATKTAASGTFASELEPGDKILSGQEFTVGDLPKRITYDMTVRSVDWDDWGVRIRTEDGTVLRTKPTRVVKTAASGRDVVCGACGHEWTTRAQYRLACPRCGAEESVRAASRHLAKYSIREENGKYWVVDEGGKRRNKEGYSSKAEAREYQKALYANTKDASYSDIYARVVFEENGVRIVDLTDSPIAPDYKVEEDWGGGQWGTIRFAGTLDEAMEIARNHRTSSRRKTASTEWGPSEWSDEGASRVVTIPGRDGYLVADVYPVQDEDEAGKWAWTIKPAYPLSEYPEVYDVGIVDSMEEAKAAADTAMPKAIKSYSGTN